MIADQENAKGVTKLTQPGAKPRQECLGFMRILGPRVNYHLESRRPFSYHVETLFQSQSCLHDRAFVKESPNERDAVWHAARRGEFRQRMSRIRSPVTACFGHLNKSGAQGERRMSGEVGDGEHLVAQRGDQKHIHLREDAGHFHGHFAPQTVTLYEVNSGEEAGLAEQIGPRVWYLSSELVNLM